MSANAHHHPALRVSDLERAARFYIDAFEGHWVTRPFVLEGDFAEMVFGGPPGTRYAVSHVGFDEGSCVELFEFLKPVVPIREINPWEGNLLHFGIQVDDVAAALARVEEAGGRRLWPEIAQWGDASVIYVNDLDQNIIELTDRSVARIAELTIAQFPEASPDAGGAR
jgi:catechol 2,3-dioxygenase-like lactoylglutathione lyase family enzyme